MEALKELVDVVKTLPDVAVWLFVLFFCYKVAIVGSVYGVIRYVVGRVCEVMEKRGERPFVTRISASAITSSAELLEISEREVIDFFRSIRNADPTDNFKSQYTKRRDLDYVLKVLREKHDADKAKKDGVKP